MASTLRGGARRGPLAGLGYLYAPHPADEMHWFSKPDTVVAPNLVMVKERLGHESIRTTVDIYGHLLPSVDAALSDGLAQLFDGASAPPENVTQFRREPRERAGDD